MNQSKLKFEVDNLRSGYMASPNKSMYLRQVIAMLNAGNLTYTGVKEFIKLLGNIAVLKGTARTGYTLEAVPVRTRETPVVHTPTSPISPKSSYESVDCRLPPRRCG